MCGFIGLLKATPNWLDTTQLEAFHNRNKRMYHRGPDDEGYYEDEHIMFGFRRLSILDLESGRQPFTYENNRYAMIFNGEIYNYIELREALQEKGVTFTTYSDTEVILAMFTEKGIDAFNELRGMFAFVIWDKKEQCLYGARDIFGIKPFYYKEENEGVYFASEQKSLLADSPSIDIEALQHYLTFQYVPEPLSMTESIQKLEPGCYFVKEYNQPIAVQRYYLPTFAVKQANGADLVDRVRDTMDQSVRMHLRSDVPIGAFLSGGIDSSFIVALAKKYHPSIKTFSVGFEQHGYSEIDVAAKTAKELGVEHYTKIISAEEYLAKLPKIMWHMDDPLADPSCVPLYFVAREAKRHVTVVLSGEGADELFGGYNIYREPDSLRVFNVIPNKAKKWLAKAAEIIPEGVKGKSFLIRGTTPLRNRYIGNAKMFEEQEKMSLMKAYNDKHRYQTVTDPLYDQIQLEHPVHQMQYIDMHTWLRGDILLKADKMTMANSLELRVPFLDKEVFEIAKGIPVEQKIAQGTTKHILRLAAKGIVPDHVLDRKKLGFPVPIRQWLKHEWYDWAKQLIIDSDTEQFFHKEVLFQLLEDHRTNKQDNSRKLWTVLMFMLWHQIFVEQAYDIEQLQEEDKTESKLALV
ncbi:asparagine synthase (glutamine-hydrolyzing) [Gracilibacillus caseinilyticus]|uniref:asparagine synthase (glutamine-hydrolyzing) n=1 Tax=Gracilibacillus caseinilyticus TaxID=2932256 RepID=A0ABY4EWS5_9BACI|nr:asparagine synthase (glutamine-hydrolyzing) [Gracilibacillus caseinilyticus]UOQ48089.1 asparagine synthase (glutamine-hydrolyzing) [Gracilibacillus caseinilyticus]